MIPPPLEELLARLQRVEAALLEGSPTVLAHPLAQTPPARAAETPVVLRPKRDSSDERAAPRPDPVAPSATAVAPLTVLASLDDVVWSVSPDGQLVFFAGGAVERLYGVTEHELLDHRGRWPDALPAADRDRLRAALARLPDAGAFTLEHRIEHPRGGRRWAVTRGKLVRDRDGRPLRVDGTTTDVTRTAETREAVFAVLEGTGAATGTEFLAKLVQHLCAATGARTAIVVEPHPQAPGDALALAVWTDGTSADPFALPARGGLTAELLSGGRAFVPEKARARHPADALLRRLGADALAAEPLIDAAGALLGFVALATDRHFAGERDVRALLKALAPRAAVELARTREDSDRRALTARLGAVERRAAEAESLLRGAADLAAVGRMAAGIAHDFANLLGVVVGNADLIREALPPDDPNRETAEAIVRAGQTVAGLSRTLLAAGKPVAPQLAPMDAGAALRALEPVLRRLSGKSAPLDFDLAPRLPMVRADATQFDRVLLNLVLNARDAVEAGPTGRGAVTVRAALAIVEPTRPGWPPDRPHGRYVAVTVSDTGCGMSAEVREKMFGSFFTTKGVRGTGLGLATVHEAVAAARGHIEVESGAGWGTHIRVFWPAVPEPPALTPRVMW